MTIKFVPADSEDSVRQSEEIDVLRGIEALPSSPSRDLALQVTARAFTLRKIYQVMESECKDS